VNTITICDLAALFHVGVPDDERARPQRLLLTVEMELDFSAAAANDDLAHTVDYYAVSRRLIGFGQGRSWKLIETLASEIAAAVLDEYPVRTVAVEVKKFIVPEARYVSVKATRSA